VFLLLVRGIRWVAVAVWGCCGVTSGSGWMAVVAIDAACDGGHFECGLVEIGQLLAEILSVLFKTPLYKTPHVYI
jgi:hypothetical protein